MVHSPDRFIESCRENPELIHLAVIGNPISHSRSPELHSFYLTEKNRSARYLAVHVDDPVSFHRFLEQSFAVPNIHGFNVTIPFKEELLKWNPDAVTLAIGAGNTVVRLQENWHSTNTDWIGFLHPIAGRQPGNAFVLGWGGSARAVVYALQKSGWNVTVVSRRPLNIPGVQSMQSDYRSFHSDVSIVDLIVNTTPIGLPSVSEQSFSSEFLKGLPETELAYDLIYKPDPTPFLSWFVKKGVSVVNGKAMLAVQAAESFRLWFGESLSDKTIQAAMTLIGK